MAMKPWSNSLVLFSISAILVSSIVMYALINSLANFFFLVYIILLYLIAMSIDSKSIIKSFKYSWIGIILGLIFGLIMSIPLMFSYKSVNNLVLALNIMAVMDTFLFALALSSITQVLTNKEDFDKLDMKAEAELAKKYTYIVFAIFITLFTIAFFIAY